MLTATGREMFREIVGKPVIENMIPATAEKR